MLPYETLEEIFDNCDIATIINFYKSGTISYPEDKLKLLICDKLEFDVSEYTLDGIVAIIKPEYQVFLLSTLGTLYHSGDGFGTSDLSIYKNEDSPELSELIENYATDQDDEAGFFPLETIELLACMIVPFKTVVLKYPTNYWRDKPTVEWYNDYKFGIKSLKLRPYITVDDPFMQVTISSDKKGWGISIDDILFATRAMASDDSRCLADEYGYRIIFKSDSKLILEPSMDNHST